MNVLEISFCVVIYNKKLSESKTLLSLIDGVPKESEARVKLVIFNNGPKLITPDEVADFFEGCSFDVQLKNALNNESLSVIYNSFIRDYFYSEVFVILDDDSVLTSEYISAVFNVNPHDYDLQIPCIQDESNVFHYPIIDNNVVETIHNGVIVSNQVFSIGSGLIISSSLVRLLSEKYNHVFDERFVFYGVDISLFMKINEMRRSGEDLKVIINGNIIHSLSKNDSEISVWRLKERFIDDVLFIIIYPKNKIKKILSLFKVFVRSLFSNGFSFSVLFFWLLINGKHPRSKYKSSKIKNKR